MLLDFSLSREFIENTEEGTESFDDNNEAISDDTDARDISSDEGSFETGDRKRKYQSLYSNSVTSGRRNGW